MAQQRYKNGSFSMTEHPQTEPLWQSFFARSEVHDAPSVSRPQIAHAPQLPLQEIFYILSAPFNRPF
jgi:hypothetical protein